MIPFKKNLFFSALIGVALVGCGGSNDKEHAQSNASQVKSAAPIVLSLTSLEQESEIQTLNTEIAVNLTDPDSRIKELILLIDGKEVQKLTNAPWSFEWESYYWANTPVLNISIKAVSKDGQSYTLENDIKVSMSEEIAKRLKLERMSDSPLKDTDKVDFKMVPVIGAASYDVAYTDNDGQLKQASTDKASIILSDMAVGTYQVSYRAVNGNGKSGPWSDKVEFSILPPDLPQLAEPVFTKSNEGYQLVFEQADLSADSILNIALLNDRGESVEPLVQGANKTSFEGLKSGNFSWRAAITNQYGHQSNWSPTKALYLPVPIIPTVHSVKVNEKADHFEVQFEWEALQNAASYHLLVRNVRSQASISITETGSSSLEKLAPGEYEVEMQQADIAGEVSAWSTPYQFKVGEFDLAFALPEKRQANSIIPSVISLDDNSHIIFTGNTLDNPNTFIRVNLLGETVVEKSIESAGSGQLVKMIQLSTKSLLAVGHTKTEQQARGFAVVLNRDGEVVSEQIYSTLIDGKLNYRFIDVVEDNDRIYALGRFDDTNNNFIADITAGSINDFVLIEPDASNVVDAQYLSVTAEGHIVVAGQTSSKLIVRSYNQDLQFKHEWSSAQDIDIESLDGFIANQTSLLVVGMDNQVHANYFKLSSSDLQLTAHSSDYVVFNAEFHHTMKLAADGSVKSFIHEGASYNYLVARTYNNELIRNDQYVHYENMPISSAPIYVVQDEQFGTLLVVTWDWNTNQLKVSQKAL
ncbi:hypothetical protein L1286_03990 [Pseudoalteromonas sp. SMS1]|uniref:hypothetical protein n=1 Tax=Pseudoalteromonas sp. SMS1 TaxID=2908894 RepID=UPI001F1E91A1|nr:hypothetical protein [Pseudoalteromonas sp. SMS1]MCF2856617.1 hypothetical protein [Pseudoalteromonas sp. SMS1]